MHQIRKHAKSLLVWVLLFGLAGCEGDPSAKDASKTNVSSPQVVPAQANERLEITPKAAEVVREALRAQNSSYLRLGLNERGGYALSVVKEMDQNQDELSQSQGIQIIIAKNLTTQIPTGLALNVQLVNGSTAFSFGASENPEYAPDASHSLQEARRGFVTKLRDRKSPREPFPIGPAEIFTKIEFNSEPGKLAALVSPDPKDGKQHPAIIWITGGESNTISDTCFAEPSPDNDQSARAFRKAGIIMMFPTLRGGNENPGAVEGFLGEVNDILAAADFLSHLSYVDPKRIYLGGHSSGGTLVLLTAECSDRFRAVFSFGPTDNIITYGPSWPFDYSNLRETQLRSPGFWLHSIHSPVFVIEGESGGITALRQMARKSTNPSVAFLEVRAADHFNILAPVNAHLAQKILADTGEKCEIKLTADELSSLMTK